MGKVQIFLFSKKYLAMDTQYSSNKMKIRLILGKTKVKCTDFFLTAKIIINLIGLTGKALPGNM